MEKVNMPLWVKRYIVAHEFAHAYSGIRNEKVTISLMEEWGFRDYERYCKWLSIQRYQNMPKNTYKPNKPKFLQDTD